MTVPDETIVAVLLETSNRKQAALRLQMSERQLYRRTQTASFLAAMRAAQEQILDDAVQRARARLSEAVDTICEIMTDRETAPSVRLSAADTLLRNAARLGALSRPEEPCDGGIWGELDKELGRVTGGRT